MDDLTDDEQLQLAIQMSLGHVSGPPPKRRRLSPPADTVEETGQQSQEPNSNQIAQRLTSQKALTSGSNATAAPTGSTGLGLPGLDRRAMEQERLARVAKRRFEVFSSAQLPAEIPTGRDTSKQLGTQTSSGKFNGPETPEHPSTHSPPLLAQQNDRNLRYPRGVIKRTWSSSHPRSNDVTIEEVLQPKLLRKAALSSFQWDTDWLWSKLDLTRTNVMVIMQAKTDFERTEITADAEAFNSRIKVCFPAMPGQVNCMHSKLMLLFYDTYMRIAIPTANLTKYDWGEDGRMENSVFMIDLPEKSQGAQQTVEELPPFGRQLHYFLSQMEVRNHLLAALLRYDFTGSRHLAFVHTIGNDRLFVKDTPPTGYLGLSQALVQLNLTTDKLELEVATSSIGALKDDFLGAFFNATRGGQSSAAPTISHKNQAGGYQRGMRIYFPSQDTVAKSLGGPDAAGTICFQRRWYNDASFPRKLLRDYKSIRSGLLSHNKILLGRGIRHDDASPATSTPVAWVYVGSHNLSESAWGRVTADRTTKQAKINCKNWECGVVMALEVAGNTDEEGFPSIDAVAAHIDIPFHYPGEGYAGREPWFFSS